MFSANVQKKLNMLHLVYKFIRFIYSLIVTLIVPPDFVTQKKSIL